MAVGTGFVVSRVGACETTGMRKFFAFLAIGSVFATVEEFLTVVVLRRDIASYLLTLIVVFPVYLTFVYVSSRGLERLLEKRAVRDVVYLFVYGGAGLVLEWTLMGLAPWSNPGANPLLMTGFQLGMFAFWATVATAPRVFLDGSFYGGRAARRILWFYVPYFVITYGLAFCVAERWRFVTVILLVIGGYLVVAGLLFLWAVGRVRREAVLD
jgi:hypothetical protein